MIRRKGLDSWGPTKSSQDIGKAAAVSDWPNTWNEMKLVKAETGYSIQRFERWNWLQDTTFGRDSLRFYVRQKMQWEHVLLAVEHWTRCPDFQELVEGGKKH